MLIAWTIFDCHHHVTVSFPPHLFRKLGKNTERSLFMIKLQWSLKGSKVSVCLCQTTHE